MNIAFMSPIGAGWYDRPIDRSEFLGSDLAAQEEAKRILRVAEPFPLVPVPARGLTGDAREALRRGLIRLVELLP